jgi:2-polyprenyl-3-methyl-5-hydroxy-6-metoxy-1,4-benzoquinol methylase
VAGSSSLFVRPNLSDFGLSPAPAGSTKEYLTYSHYNFLRPGLIAKIKSRRFEVALRMAREHFGKTGAIDMGCADGILLPSLSRYFPHVVGIDPDERVLATARGLLSGIGATNVELIANAGLSTDDLLERLSGRAYGVMFLLDTLEHIGRSPASMYDDKLAFVDEMFRLLVPGGVMIISVPKMVGPAFLAKYAVQTALGMHRERVSATELFRAGLLLDASPLEPHWSGGHIGFDQRRLARLVKDRVDVLEQRSLTATLMWAIRRR